MSDIEVYNLAKISFFFKSFNKTKYIYQGGGVIYQRRERISFIIHSFCYIFPEVYVDLSLHILTSRPQNLKDSDLET